MQIEIRPIRENDVPNIVKAFTFPWSSQRATAEKWECYFLEHVQHRREVYLVELHVELKQQLIGYASLLTPSPYPGFSQDNTPEINDVWIAEEWREKGFGRDLIHYLEETARKKGYTHIGLGVGLYADYGPAQTLYFKMGYVPNGRGITYKTAPVIPGELYPVDDDLVLWLKKAL